MARAKLDLDVDTPEKIPEVLEEAARRFYEDAGELEASWQDKNAGRPWRKIARILEDAAKKIDRALGD